MWPIEEVIDKYFLIDNMFHLIIKEDQSGIM